MARSSLSVLPSHIIASIWYLYTRNKVSFISYYVFRVDFCWCCCCCPIQFSLWPSSRRQTTLIVLRASSTTTTHIFRVPLRARERLIACSHAERGNSVVTLFSQLDLHHNSQPQSARHTIDRLIIGCHCFARRARWTTLEIPEVWRWIIVNTCQRLSPARINLPIVHPELSKSEWDAL